jgi:hypothetical protein
MQNIYKLLSKKINVVMIILRKSMYLFLKVVEQNSSLVSHTNDLDLAT